MDKIKIDQKIYQLPDITRNFVEVQEKLTCLRFKQKFPKRNLSRSLSKTSHTARQHFLEGELTMSHGFLQSAFPGEHWIYFLCVV